MVISKKDQSQRGKISAEVDLLVSLAHPNIIKISDTWEDTDRCMIVFITELMTSGTVRDFVNNQTTCVCGCCVVRFYIRFVSSLAWPSIAKMNPRESKIALAKVVRCYVRATWMEWVGGQGGMCVRPSCLPTLLEDGYQGVGPRLDPKTTLDNRVIFVLFIYLYHQSA